MTFDNVLTIAGFVAVIIANAVVITMFVMNIKSDVRDVKTAFEGKVSTLEREMRDVESRHDECQIIREKQEESINSKLTEMMIVLARIEERQQQMAKQ